LGREAICLDHAELGECRLDLALDEQVVGLLKYRFGM
jgi:hypothetical protein